MDDRKDPPGSAPAPDVEERAAALERQIATDPRTTSAYFQLAKLYMLAGRKEQAAEVYKRLLAVAPANVLARRALADLGVAAPAASGGTGAAPRPPARPAPARPGVRRPAQPGRGWSWKWTATALVVVAIGVLIAMRGRGGRPGPSNTLALPGTASDFRLARDGALLVARVPDKRVVAVVDLASRKLLGTVPLPSAETRMACGGDRLLLFDPGSAMFEVHDLGTLAKLRAARATTPGVVCEMEMGAGNGSLAFLRKADSAESYARAWYEVCDVDSLECAERRVELTLAGIPHTVNHTTAYMPNRSYGDRERIRLDAGGAFVVSWNGSKFFLGHIEPDRVVLPAETAFTFAAGGRDHSYYDGGNVGFALPLPRQGVAVTQFGQAIADDGRILAQQQVPAEVAAPNLDQPRPWLPLYPEASGAFYVGFYAGQLEVFDAGDHIRVTGTALEFPRRLLLGEVRDNDGNLETVHTETRPVPREEFDHRNINGFNYVVDPAESKEERARRHDRQLHGQEPRDGDWRVFANVNLHTVVVVGDARRTLFFFDFHPERAAPAERRPAPTPPETI